MPAAGRGWLGKWFSRLPCSGCWIFCGPDSVMSSEGGKLDPGQPTPGSGRPPAGFSLLPVDGWAQVQRTCYNSSAYLFNVTARIFKYKQFTCVGRDKDSVIGDVALRPLSRLRLVPRARGPGQEAGIGTSFSLHFASLTNGQLLPCVAGGRDGLRAQLPFLLLSVTCGLPVPFLRSQRVQVGMPLA
jgi:hypothetical protein